MMMTVLRKIMFYVFLLIYTICAPWLILRMLGFIWHPSSFHLVKTGLVIIHSTPPDANVYVDGKHASTQTPVTVRELVPGDHFIRLEKEGFHDWVNRIAISSNKATILEDIILKPSTP